MTSESQRLSLVPEDGALRAHLTEDEWARVLTAARADLVEDDKHPGMPPWAEPARPAPSSVGDDDLDAALTEAALLRAPALEIELATSQGERGLLGVIRSDLTSASAVVRRIMTTPGGGPEATSLTEGIEVSAFPLDRLMDEVMRLVPDPGEVIPVAAAAIPMELSVSLGAALRGGDREMVEAVCADLGIGEPPEIIRSLVHSLAGSCAVSVRGVGAGPVSVGSWMLADCGWVEVTVDDEDIVHHRVISRRDLRTRILDAAAGRVDAALRQAADDG